MLGGRVALLPLWLLPVLLAAGAGSGALVLEAADSELAGAIAGGVVGWGAIFVARRVLARLGHRSFDELPSAESEELVSSNRGAIAHLLGATSYMLALGAIYLVLDAFGVRGGEYVAFVVAFPVWFEVDARLGLRARRRRAEEAEGLRAAVDEAVREERTLLAGDDVVPVRRGRAIGTAILLAAMSVVCLAVAVLAEDAGAIVRVVCLVGAPAFAFGAASWVRLARAPFFLSADVRGADLLGAGPVPWEAIVLVEVAGGYNQRWLELVLADEEEAQAAPWFTRAHKRLLQHGALRGTLVVAGQPPERIVALIRRHHDAPVGVDLGEEDAEGART